MNNIFIIKAIGINCRCMAQVPNNIQMIKTSINISNLLNKMPDFAENDIYKSGVNYTDITCSFESIYKNEKSGDIIHIDKNKNMNKEMLRNIKTLNELIFQDKYKNEITGLYDVLLSTIIEHITKYMKNIPYLLIVDIIYDTRELLYKYLKYKNKYLVKLADYK
jgi:hypothetical protein